MSKATTRSVLFSGDLGNTINQSSAIPKPRRVTTLSLNQPTEIGCTMSNVQRRRWNGLSKMPPRTGAQC
jgi:hypothetical protein